MLSQGFDYDYENRFDYEEFDYVSDEAKLLIDNLLVKKPISKRFSAAQCINDNFIKFNLCLGEDGKMNDRTLSSNMRRNLKKLNARKKWRVLGKMMGGVGMLQKNISIKNLQISPKGSCSSDK